MLTNTVLLLVTLVGGPVEEATDCCCLSKLEAFMGTWEAKEVDIDGKKCTVTAAWRSVLDGKFIEHQWAVTDPQSNQISSGLAMIGQDPSDGKIRMWTYASDGSLAANTLAKRHGSKFTWTSDQGQDSMDYEVIGDDTFLWSHHTDGRVTAITAKRAGPEESVSCPKRSPKLPQGANEKLKEIAWWAGDFTMIGNDPYTDKSHVGKTKCGWIFGSKFLLYDNATVDSDLIVGRYRAIIGLDPDTGKITGWEFDNTASVGKYIVTGKGQKIEGKAVSPDAGTLKYTGTIKPTDDGLDYQASGELQSGEVRPYHWVWKRNAED